MRVPIALLGYELIYSLIIVILCLFIYFKTKNLYKITKHKGIKYFRNTFLFFTLGFGFRLFTIIQTLYNVLNQVRVPMHMYGLHLVLLSFLSIMTILSIMMSILWKKIDVSDNTLYVIAFILSLIFVVFKLPFVLLIIQLIIFASVVVVSIILHKDRKFKKLHITYILLFLIWIVNLFTAVSPAIVPIGYQFILYIVSILLFIIILIKSLKWTK